MRESGLYEKNWSPTRILPTKGVKPVTYIITCPDKQLVLSLFRSQLTIALNYNPASWRVPYDHVVYKDPKQILVSYYSQSLFDSVLNTGRRQGTAAQVHQAENIHVPKPFINSSSQSARFLRCYSPIAIAERNQYVSGRY